MQKTTTFAIIMAAVLLAALGVAWQAQAASVTWTSASQGYWTNAGNWAGGAPGAGDAAVFNSGANGNAIIDGNVTVNSLGVSGYTGKIIFTNAAAGDLTVTTDLTLGSTATIMPQYSSLGGTGTGRVITVGGNATIDGVIDANGHGFGMGAGTGFSGNSSSHGGISVGGGAVYGSLTQPTALGSGGRTTSASNKGGGAVKLVVAGTLTVNGRISADATRDSHAGAAGGSVWLTATTLAGSGQISANGTDSTSGDSNARPGGGGRVALEYTNSTYSGVVSIAGGYDFDGGISQHSQPGTLWAPAGFLAAAGSPGSPQSLTITNSYQYYPADTNSVFYWNLTVAGGAWVEFHSNRLNLADLTVTGAGNLRFDRYRTGAHDLLGLTVTNSITLAAGTNWLYLPAEGSYNLSGALSVGALANVYLFGNTSTVNGYGVTVTAQTATVDGTISGRGFPAGAGPTFGVNSSGHGGVSGGSSTAYGSLTQPTELGGGGRTTGANYGGGALKLVVAGTATVAGRIAMDGSGDTFAGSAGGSVWLIANTLAGAGQMSANAGVMASTDGNNRGGGGGRVAIEYTNSTFTGSISAAGALSTISSSYHGQPGTLWAPKNFLWASGTPGGPQAVTITNSFQFYPAETNATYYWDLTVKGAWVELHSNALYVSNLLLTNHANLRFDRLRSGLNDIGSLSITNSITLAAGTNYLYLPSEGSYTLVGDLFVGTNALLYTFANTNAINAAAGGTTANRYGSGVTIRVQSATVNGTIRGQGFPGGRGPTYAGTSSGHGGRSGGNSLTYGSLTQPTELGSGGYGTSYPDMLGGGAIRMVVAGTLTVDGSVSMDGLPTSGGNVLGGGAGGSVCLIASTLAGTGTVSAIGGVVTHSDGNARAGGGGRVALEYNNSTFTGSVLVPGGTDVTGPSEYGKTGTLFQCQSVQPLADSDGVGGVSLATALSVSFNSNGMRVARTLNEWVTKPTFQSLTWTDTSSDWNSNALNNVATYSLVGGAAGLKVTVLTNDVVSVVTNYSSTGTVSFAVSLAPSCTVHVEAGGLPGTVMLVR